MRFVMCVAPETGFSWPQLDRRAGFPLAGHIGTLKFIKMTRSPETGFGR